MHERKDAGEERWRTGVSRKGGMLDSWVAGQADKGKVECTRGRMRERRDGREERFRTGGSRKRRKQERSGGLNKSIDA